MHETIDKSSKEWLAYNMHRVSSHKRRTDRNGNLIEFRLSFEQWLDIWMASGKWHKRGRLKGCYCMSRHNDIGHYEVGNVKIITHSENVSEAMKGINSWGENNPKSKLTEKDIRDIRALYSTGNSSRSKLAEKYNVSCSTIYRVLYRHTWKHVA